MDSGRVIQYLTVTCNVDHVLFLEALQLLESFCCVVTAYVELRDHLALFRDLPSTGFDVPKEPAKAHFEEQHDEAPPR